VVGNDAPVAEPDEVLSASDTPVADLDVGANDYDVQGETLECTPGPLSSAPPGLVESAAIDSQCLVDLTPVVGAGGVATLEYQVCDVHPLSQPKGPATPTYGTDGRQPGDLANRCTAGVLTATIVAPPVDPPDPDDADPAPQCAPDEAATLAGQGVDIDVLANDSDLDLGGDPSPLVVAAAGIEGEQGVSEKGGVAEATDDQATVRYTPPAGFTGTDTVLYSAQDTVGKGCSATVRVTVTAPPGPTTPDPTTPDPTTPDPTTPDPTTPDPTTPGPGTPGTPGPGGAGGGGGTGGGQGAGASGGAGAGSPSERPRTGTSSTGRLVQLGLGVLVGGAGLVLAGRTRRRATRAA
jgi:hypothetical protein